MADLAADLKQRFVWAEDLCLEAYEVLPDGRSFVRSDRDELAIGIFRRLSNTVDAIPPALIATAEQLRAVQPKAFEERLTQTIRAVGSGFSPATAAEFLDKVMDSKRGRRRSGFR